MSTNKVINKEIVVLLLQHLVAWLIGMDGG